MVSYMWMGLGCCDGVGEFGLLCIYCGGLCGRDSVVEGNWS